MKNYNYNYNYNNYYFLTSFDWKLSTSLAKATQQLSTDFLSYKERKHSGVKFRTTEDIEVPSMWLE